METRTLLAVSDWQAGPVAQVLQVAGCPTARVTTMTPARDPKQGKYMDLVLILIGFNRFLIRMG